MRNQLEELKAALDLSITKKAGAGRTASFAESRSGAVYRAGLVESDTNLLNIPSEHVALALATLSNDYRVTRVTTLVECPAPGEAASPLALKIIADYAIRSPEPLAYAVLGPDGSTLFQCEDVLKALPFYSPAQIELARTGTAPSPNREEAPEGDAASILKGYAIRGLEKNFPLYDSASGYGTAILSKSGRVYFGGQYSSPDKRLSLHSEMAVMLSALMAGDMEITHLGLVSTKYPDEPCNMCGICRQFVSEMSARFGFELEILCFAKETDAAARYTMSEYLPSTWTSKKWNT